jgi:hypothetical protein
MRGAEADLSGEFTVACLAGATLGLLFGVEAIDRGPLLAAVAISCAILTVHVMRKTLRAEAERAGEVGRDR